MTDRHAFLVAAQLGETEPWWARESDSSRPLLGRELPYEIEFCRFDVFLAPSRDLSFLRSSANQTLFDNDLNLVSNRCGIHRETLKHPDVICIRKAHNRAY